MDAPSVSERYSSATESSNLRLKETRCDVDYLIAAGWAGDRLGAMLYRLATEYDRVAGTIRRAEAELRRAEILAAFESQRVQVGPTREVQILEQARQSAVTERVLVLMQLKTLDETKRAIGQFAIVQATKQRFMRPDQDALKMAGRALDVFLDPNCPHCDGRGYSGGGRHEESGPQVQCRPCSGTGKRRNTIGRDDEERRFGAFLLSELERMTSSAEVEMRKYLRLHEQ